MMTDCHNDVLRTREMTKALKEELKDRKTECKEGKYIREKIKNGASFLSF
jgi:hypothetical protein